MKRDDKDVSEEPKSESKVFTLEEREEIALSEVESMMDREIQDAMPETPAIDLTDIEAWINTEPISLEDQKGKVIMLAFWAYTDIFCLRSIPIERKLFKKYEQYGFKIISIHCAEYEFAKDLSNVRKAVAKYKIDFPAAADKENKTWQTYGNMYIPKHVLIDSTGMIRYEIAGYSNIRDYEVPIYGLLREAGQHPPPYFEDEELKDEIYDIYGSHYLGTTVQTWESLIHPVSVGYARTKQFGNSQWAERDKINEFNDSGHHLDKVVYLRGKWFWDKECVRFAGKAGDNAGIVIPYSARRANAILGTQDGKSGTVEVSIDGKYVTEKYFGSDLKIKDGVSYADIQWTHVHNLIKTEEAETHEIEIIPKTENIVFYAFLFS
ncbi:MAG: alkyl hydroperoxide reductase subunit AhpC [Candidatus Nitrosomirales archaeon]|jgi:alkyl hydroperoxide reductase subunit AhpC